MRLIRRYAVTAIVACALLMTASAAHAGGMVFDAHGARPLGRAGAFVAGADDANALYYNPAGLADIEGFSFLVDGALVLQSASYTRVDSGGNTQPKVNGKIDILPLPQLALTWKPRRAKWFTLGIGLWAPYISLNSYPADGPQRYSHVTLKGSLIVIAEVALAFRLGDHVYLGAAFQNMFLKFASQITLSGCTQVNCAPEDPRFDVPSQLVATSAFTPSGILGLTIAFEKFRFAVSGQLPFWVRANGTVESRLPTDPQYVDASISGNKAKLAFDLPWQVRGGFELRVPKELRLELMMAYAGWSMQNKFNIDPENVFIEGVPGVGRYQLGPLAINRSMVNVFSVALGGECEVLKKRLWLRAGWMLETSATPAKTQTVLTPDGLRNYIAVGISTRVGSHGKLPVRLDVSYAHVIMQDRTVTNSQSYQLNPIRPDLAVAVGNGRYNFEANILAAGLNANF